MPREGAIKSDFTLEQFLEFEATAGEKHEFVDGKIFAMEGGTRRHNRIAVRLGTLLENAAENTPCLVAIADTFVLADQAPYYPDVMVYCENEEDPRIVKKPCAIVEVLSRATADLDRGEKWLNYQKIDSLQTYVLLEQDTAQAEVYSRTAQGWLYERIEASGSLRLGCVGLEVPLEAVYTRL